MIVDDVTRNLALCARDRIEYRRSPSDCQPTTYLTYLGRYASMSRHDVLKETTDEGL